MLFVQELVKDYTSLEEINVQWGEMDAMQHVNNLVYLRYFESSRIKYFVDYLKIGVSPDGLGAILAEISCKYKFPLTYPDKIISGVRPMIETLDDYSIQMHQIVVSLKHERIAAEGVAKIVFYDYNKGKKAIIPAHIKDALIASVNKNSLL